MLRVFKLFAFWFVGFLVAALLARVAGAQSTLDAFQSAVYDSSPLLYYTFDNDSIGNGTVADAMGAYVGGYVTGADLKTVASVQGPHGVLGQVPYTTPGADFRGTNAYVTTGAPASLGSNMNDGFSVSFWINSPSTAAAWTQLFGTLNSGNTTGLTISLNRDQGFGYQSKGTLLFVRDDAGRYVSAATAADIYNNRWQHVAMVVQPRSVLPASAAGYDYNNYVQVYINGQPASLAFGTSNITTSSTFSNFGFSPYLGTINDRGASPTSFANAAIDEFAIFGRPLSAAEIQSHLAAMPKYDFAYDGTYPADSMVPPLGQTTWKVVGSAMQSINTEGDGSGGSIAKTGFMRVFDTSTSGRSSFHQLFDGQDGRPGLVADVGWTYEARLKIDSLDSARPYLGLYGEGGSSGGNGKSIMLAFEQAPDDKLLVSYFSGASVINLGELLLEEYYDYKVQKYWDPSASEFFVQAYVDGNPLGNAKQYSSFSAGAPYGFGFFGSTPGTADITFDYVTFVIPEPSTFLLLGSALLGLLLWRRH